MHLCLDNAAPSFGTRDVAQMCRKLTCLVEEHLIDRDIRNWLIPDFTTTTDNDVAVASMLILATFKHFFSYEGCTGCGFPP